MDIVTILKKYIKDDEDISYCKCKLIFNKRESEYLKFYQFGGEKKYNIEEDNIEYQVDYYQSVMSDQTIIYIMNKNKEDNRFPYCVMLTYTNNDNIHIEIIETPIKCININPETKYGDIMMKIIKDYAKKNNFKTITLDDESNYICKNTQFDSKYSLKYGSVLTSGQPWYYKYDFVYIDKNHDIVLYNQEKIKRLKTTDLPFEILIYILSSSILQKYILKINSVHYVIFLILLAKNIVMCFH